MRAASDILFVIPHTRCRSGNAPLSPARLSIFVSHMQPTRVNQATHIALRCHQSSRPNNLGQLGLMPYDHGI